MQVGRLAGAARDRALDEVEGLVEALHQLGSDDVGVQRSLGVDDALRQAEDEVALLHVFGDLDQLTEQCHGAPGAVGVGVRESIRCRVGAGSAARISASVRRASEFSR